MTLDPDQYEGLGRLLHGAGVDPVEVEVMVARLLAAEARKSREQLSHHVHVQVSDEIDRLEKRHRDISIDTRRLIASIRSHTEIHQRTRDHSHVFVRRVGILILVMQLVLAAMFAAIMAGWWPQPRCGTTMASSLSALPSLQGHCTDGE